MKSKKLIEIGDYTVELLLPPALNNINVYWRKGAKTWNIAELLKFYSDNSGHKYYSESYFDVRPNGHNKIYCVGFYNHCEIDLDSQTIIRIVNNR